LTPALQRGCAATPNARPTSLLFLAAKAGFSPPQREPSVIRWPAVAANRTRPPKHPASPLLVFLDLTLYASREALSLLPEVR